MTPFCIPSHLFALIIHLLFLAVGIFTVIFTKSCNEQVRKKENENIEAFTKEKFKILTNYNETTMKQYVKMRELKHDFSNHVCAIRGLLEKNDVEHTKSYINELCGKFDTANDMFFSKYPLVDALFLNKTQEAHKLGIKTEFHIIDPEDLKIEDMEICSFISNLLDNAIAGASQCSGEKKIVLRSYNKGSKFVVVVKNSSNPVCNLDTSKKDKNNHGLGIEIVKKIANKYGGNATFSYDDGVFTAIVYMDI